MSYPGLFYPKDDVYLQKLKERGYFILVDRNAKNISLIPGGQINNVLANNNTLLFVFGKNIAGTRQDIFDALYLSGLNPQDITNTISFGISVDNINTPESQQWITIFHQQNVTPTVAVTNPIPQVVIPKPNTQLTLAQTHQPVIIPKPIPQVVIPKPNTQLTLAQTHQPVIIPKPISQVVIPNPIPQLTLAQTHQPVVIPKPNTQLTLAQTHQPVIIPKPNTQLTLAQTHQPVVGNNTGQTRVVCVKVADIRPNYDDLGAWMDNPNNVYIARRGVVYITRNGVKHRFPKENSIWANPFKIGEGATREMVINKYRDYIIEKLNRGDISREQLLQLKGKTLGCWCKVGGQDIPCHGDVLVELINRYT